MKKKGYFMDYKLLNESQRERMKQISQVDFKMEWENPEFLDTLMGKLPDVRQSQSDEKIKSEVYELKKLLDSYNAFLTNKEQFYQEVKKAVKKIQSIEQYWYGLNPYDVERSLRQHEFCLIYGEGGIGKSYFIKCLEEKLSQKAIPHLCIYGKFEKDTCNIDIDGIIKDSSSGFVFIVDAINEMSYSGQEDLLSLLIKLKKHSSIRIIVTYRTNAMDDTILSEYKQIASAEYLFPGVSFESVLAKILKLPIPDVYKYEDILYSNNPLLLNMLCATLSDMKLVYETENSIASVTFILEHYIKRSVGKNFKGKTSYRGVDIWNDTKRVAEWMYQHGKKNINIKNLLCVVETGESFLKIMTQSGFMNINDFSDEEYAYFTIDTLTDYLIVRSMFKDIAGKTLKEQVEIINNKAGDFYDMEEIIIIFIFDKYAPDYKCIKKLLIETNLLNKLQYETLVKIIFKEDEIKKFLEVFEPLEPNKLLTIFGGYVDKPFNCTNYLNSYYKLLEHQNKDLSETLSGYYFHTTLKGRLKNILYFITLNDRKDRRVEEAFYFSLWCCAAPNKDIRCLAVKLLYEILIKEPEYKKALIKEYEKLSDVYIKEAIIYVLAKGTQNDVETSDFFRNIIIDEEYLTSKSIKRISAYLNDKYGYISWNRKNLYIYEPEALVSDFINEIFFRIDIFNKHFLPFRYRGKDNIDMYPEFISADKSKIQMINKYLEKTYGCVKDGDCNGLVAFESYVKDEIEFNAYAETLDINSFISSYEVVIKKIFNLNYS